MNATRRSRITTRRFLVAMSLAAVTAMAQASSADLTKVVVSDTPTTTAVSVLDAKARTSTGDQVAVVGRVKDFVEGQAVFTIADTSMKSCKDNGENCPTPWDYCCESKETITKNTATVKIVGAPGGKRPIKAGVKGVGGVDHLVTVTALGVAQRDPAGNLVILAEKVHVKK